MNFKRIILALVALGATSLFAEDENIKTDAWKLNKSWTLKDGKFTVSTKASSFLFLKKKITLSKMEFEVEITPMKAEGTGWKVVGVVLYKSPTEHWQFALIEAPEKYAKRHFVELKCQKGKVWGAESKFKLKRLVNKSFKWEYGKSYKLKIKFSPTRIDGFVYAKDDDDKALAHIAYELKGDAVKTGMPALKCVRMKAVFGDMEMEN